MIGSVPRSLLLGLSGLIAFGATMLALRGCAPFMPDGAGRDQSVMTLPATATPTPSEPTAAAASRTAEPRQPAPAVGTTAARTPDTVPPAQSATRPAVPEAQGPALAARPLPADRAPLPANPPPGASAAPPTDAAAPAFPPPRFDVVRVGARGTAVLAGRAAPGAEILLFANGDRELARTRADRRGEWVLLPADPLAPGTYVFTLRARLAGTEIAGPDSVVIVVPDSAVPTADPQPRIAGADPARPASSDPSRAPASGGGALAVLIPPGGDGATPRLLQSPAGVAVARNAIPTPAAAATTPNRLSLEAVDYADAGAMRFSGTAQPGAAVRAYVGDRHAGDAVADAEGRWTLVPALTPAVGRHTLRLDQIAASGTVAARIEMPFQRDQMAEESFAGGQVVVQPGQSLWRIARLNYGRGVRYTTIYEANRAQIRDAALIFPGQVFAVPPEGGTPAAAR